VRTDLRCLRVRRGRHTWVYSRLLLALGLGALVAVARAEVSATQAWVRGTVAAQKSTGAFVTLRSTEEATVVGVSSPLAQTVEIHASTMSGGVMHMQAIEALALPAGKTVALAPGGYHVMLIGLRKPLQEGDVVPIDFIIENRHGKRSQIEVRALVRPLAK